MYRCGVCGGLSGKGERMHKKVVATRRKEYQCEKLDRSTGRVVESWTTSGWEIAEETNCHRGCLGSDAKDAGPDDNLTKVRDAGRSQSHASGG